MHLIWFHRVLIGTAILFFLGFGGWELANYRNNGEATALALAIGSILIAVALAIYLKRLRRILKL